MEITPNSATKFYCNICDFKCCKNVDWERHILTRKHTINIKPQQLIKNGNKNSQKNICSKNYESRSGLWRHEKKCKLISPIKPLLLNSEEKCKTM